MSFVADMNDLAKEDRGGTISGMNEKVTVDVRISEKNMLDIALL